MVYRIIEYSNPVKNEVFYMKANDLDELSTLLLEYYNMDHAIVNIKDSEYYSYSECYSYVFNITKSLDHLFEDSVGSLVLTGLHSGYIEVIPE
jgi:hypothetical protein